MDHKERIELVAHYFTKGKSISEIVDILRDRHQLTNLSREVPYADIALAAKKGWLKFEKDEPSKWADELTDKYPFLLDAVVPAYGGRLKIVAEAAEMMGRNIFHIAKTLTKEYISDWNFPCGFPSTPTPNELPGRLPLGMPIRRSRKNRSGPDRTPPDEPDGWWRAGPEDSPGLDPIPLIIEIRLGFSGGSTIGLMSGDLGRYLEKRLDLWEKELKDYVFDDLKVKAPDSKIKRRFKVKIRLLFVNLVSGFDTSPVNHPIAWLTSMIDSNEELASRSELMCFSASPFVEISAQKDPINAFYGAKMVKEFVVKYGLDIIVTSAGSLADEHSTLRNYIRKGTGPETENKIDPYEIFKKEGVKGDILFQPIQDRTRFKYGPLIGTTEGEAIRYRPMTLLDLEELADQKESIRDILLVAAPCGYCGRPKDDILRAILSQKDALVSHVVADWQSVGRLLGKTDPELF